MSVNPDLEKLAKAVAEALLEDAAPCMVGEMKCDIVRSPLADSWTKKKPLDPLLLRIAGELV